VDPPFFGAESSFFADLRAVAIRGFSVFGRVFPLVHVAG
jgi:hypothetical protein